MYAKFLQLICGLSDLHRTYYVVGKLWSKDGHVFKTAARNKNAVWWHVAATLLDFVFKA